jgi:FkbM family methyltransferase
VNLPATGHLSLLRRAISRIARIATGDRVLLDRRMADTLWHLQSVRHRIRGGRIVVRFDNLDADIILDARSDLALRAIGAGSYEAELLHVLPALVGCGDLVNVGANVGIVAIVLGKAAGDGKRLLCIDPIPECVELLRINLANANLGERTIILQAFAAASADGPREIWTVPGKPEYSSGAPIVHEAVAADRKVRQIVPTIRIDDAVAELKLTPSAIVMDCEGGELSVLQGAAATLAGPKPTIILEIVPPLLAAHGCGTADLLRFFADVGYGCMTLDPKAADVATDFSGTMVAVPADRLAAVRHIVQRNLAGA